MNTMLPFPSFAECARVHPTRALHRQIIEADDCLRHLLADPAYPPRRKSGHPCVEMWRGHIDWLQIYRDEFVHEWLSRTLALPPPAISLPARKAEPAWLESDDLHRTYREHLLAKYGADPTACLEAGVKHQPDEWFIEASRDWTEQPILHRPFPFPEATP